MTNCTQKDIRAIVGRNRGQIEDNTDTQGNKQTEKMKNKKNQKKFIYKKIEKRQRSCWVLQKGEGLFISLKALCGLL